LNVHRDGGMGQTPDTPLAAARGLRGLITENRDTTESGRKLADPIVRALIDSKLCRMALPVADGGLETSPLDAFEVYEELASAEAAVAWVVWNNSLVCWFARYLSREVREQVFGDPEHLFANSTRPTGRAVPEGAGYRVNGRWSLVSGCPHAQWIPVMCLVEKDGEVEMLASGAPHMRMALAPRERYEILDTWYSGGLRGTGSHDVVLTDEPVPAERSFAPFVDKSQFDSRFGRVPIVATMSAGCASICLGIARAALDALVDLAREKTTPDPGPDLRDRAQTQATVARTQTLLRGLRSGLFESYERLWNSLNDANLARVEDLAGVWSAAITTAIHCRSSVSEIYGIAGASSLYTDSPIERAHRDIYAVLQHVALQPFWLEQAGRVRLGLEPTHPLFSS
jgi:alkylation response protein AidB-like acyl-CoA dehydrogenase